MSTAAKDAFKLGFLTRCAEERLTGEKIDERLALLDKAANWLGSAANAGLAVTAGLPFGLGLLGGGALGMGTAHLTQPKLSDDEIKAQELAHTYRVYADRIKARRKTKQYR